MADDTNRPLLNPVLQLNMESRRETPTGGGKGRGSVVTARLPSQQRVLSSAARDLYQRRERLQTYHGRTHLLVQMFASDSLAPSYTPTDLFSGLNGCQLVAPFRNGYVVEAQISALPTLEQAILHPTNFAAQTDISRVEALRAFGTAERLRSRSLEELWNAAPEESEGKRFILWFAPYRDSTARELLLQEVEGMSGRLLVPTFSQFLIANDEALDPPGGVVQPHRQSSIARAMRTYRNTGVGRAVVRVTSIEAMRELVASGVSHRIDPIRRVQLSAPGEGAEPIPPLATTNDPIVGVVDGGLHVSSYRPSEAWRVPPLIPDHQADRRHGNAVSSLVVQGHAWNSNRDLPTLNCRLGTVQAVPASGTMLDERDLVDYLHAVVRSHPETRVWNISANQIVEDSEFGEVSTLGHELSELARSAGILPVISIGNVTSPTRTKLCPPADCEAAITVGGRSVDQDGLPADGCPQCASGPGPDGMLKPDLAWFSQLRMLGGGTGTGSSYPTALVSSLAAHTFHNLREPSPDLVKALLISAGERASHDPKLGWGSPYSGHPPWTCEPGSVTLAWKAKLQPGVAYYWTDIPIPPELIQNGKLFGKATLTAVLNPLVSPHGGANYFSSRLETALQFPRGADKWGNLLGTMEESTLPEQEARDDLKKWNPIRRHCRDFSKRDGLNFSGSHLKLYARVFTRDLYQFGWTRHTEAGEQDVAFVLKLWAADSGAPIYNSMVSSLGNFVESALITQDIQIDA